MGDTGPVGQQFVRQRGAGVQDDVLHRTALDDAAVLDPGHRVGDLPDHLHLVGDEDDRQAELVAQMAEQAEDRSRGGRIQSGGRLVGEQVGRAEREGAGDPDALLLTAGKLGGIELPAIREAHPLKQFGDTLVDGVLGGVQVLQRQGDVLGDRASAQQRGGLEDDADTAAGGEQLVTVEAGEVLAVDTHGAAGGTLQETDTSRQGALTGAAGADHGEDLAAPHGQRYVVEHGAVTESLGQVLDLDHGGSLSRTDARRVTGEAGTQSDNTGGVSVRR